MIPSHLLSLGYADCQDNETCRAIAHLWFVAIRPFDCGNARIVGIITNMLLARSDNTSHRFYSMSAQITSDRKQYHSILEKTQNENFDVTGWMLWFFDCMQKALKTTDIILLNVIKKSEFWKIHNKTPLNNRQRLVINKLLSGIDGKLQSSKWAQIAKCSSDTALRDIKDLIKKEILCRKSQGGRSTNYDLAEF
jgi:Fic family protein